MTRTSAIRFGVAAVLLLAFYLFPTAPFFAAVLGDREARAQFNMAPAFMSAFMCLFGPLFFILTLLYVPTIWRFLIVAVVAFNHLLLVLHAIVFFAAPYYEFFTAHFITAAVVSFENLAISVIYRFCRQSCADNNDNRRLQLVVDED